MRKNLPVTQREYDYPKGVMLVSTTDTRGIIRHCNRAFIETSGYTHDELIGQPHNLIRHPDMPPEAFRDLWETVQRGQPWNGFVKNRRKNGDHYWVHANVTPIVEGGRPVGYLSVRVKPTRDQIRAAEALYARIAVERESGVHTFRVTGGRVVRTGWPGRLDELMHPAPADKLRQLLMAMGLAGLFPQLLGLPPWLAAGLSAAALAVGGAYVARWFRERVLGGIQEATTFARDIAACNLTRPPEVNPDHPLGDVLLALRQIQVNLRAVVGDVRFEISGLRQAADDIAAGSRDLAERTKMQACNLEETAAAMEQLASTLRQTADTASRVAQQSEQSSTVVYRGGEAVRAVGDTMNGIEQSSRKVSEIIHVIEGIAHRTNMLALNAAVEAARAGDQGLGFAVVASEVRALAQRTAEAASEVSSLIRESTQQVAAGSSQMHGASATIHEVVSSVGQVSTLVLKITEAAQEQSMGIAQVNEAVTQLDTVTQKNAQLVDISAANARALAERAHTLNQTIDVFRLQGT